MGPWLRTLREVFGAPRGKSNGGKKKRTFGGRSFCSSLRGRRMGEGTRRSDCDFELRQSRAAA